MTSYQPIRYSDPWDKLKDARHTTIRNQFSLREGLPPLDKSISYYKAGKLYTEMLQDKTTYHNEDGSFRVQHECLLPSRQVQLIRSIEQQESRKAWR